MAAEEAVRNRRCPGAGAAPPVAASVRRAAALALGATTASSSARKTTRFKRPSTAKSGEVSQKQFQNGYTDEKSSRRMKASRLATEVLEVEILCSTKANADSILLQSSLKPLKSTRKMGSSLYTIDHSGARLG